jgi:hypothetical protein
MGICFFANYAACPTRFGRSCSGERICRLGLPESRPVQRARHDILLCRVDPPGEGFHPIRPPCRLRRRPPRASIISYVTRPKRSGAVDVLECVTMQVFGCEHCPMIAARVQCDIDVIPKWSHHARVPPMGYRARSARYRATSHSDGRLRSRCLRRLRRQGADFVNGRSEVVPERQVLISSRVADFPRPEFPYLNRPIYAWL